MWTKEPIFFRTPSTGCRVIGHRGAMGVAPENTLASFERGVQDGADFVELDVHLSRDREAVVIHDERVDRTTDGKGEVSALTVPQLKRLDAGAWFSPAFRGERIPTLPEVLAWAKSQRCWNGTPLGVIIEVKPVDRKLSHKGQGRSPQGDLLRLTERVMHLVQAAGMVERVVVISFDTRVLMVVKRCAAGQALGWLYSRRWMHPLPQATALGVHVLFPRFNRVSHRVVRAAHHQGLAVATWTVNTPPAMRRCLTLGVDAIATNFPARLRRLLDTRS